jgi:hypothetical protein
MCVVETSTAGREYKVRDMAQADFGYARRRRDDAMRCDAKRDFCARLLRYGGCGRSRAVTARDARRRRETRENDRGKL